MAIRPAVDTLRALAKGKTLDELAIKINDACQAVKSEGKPATVILEIKITPYGSKDAKLVEPTVLLTGKVASKLPKSLDATIFYLDESNNPTVNKPREESQGGLPFSIAPGAAHG